MFLKRAEGSSSFVAEAQSPFVVHLQERTAAGEKVLCLYTRKCCLLVAGATENDCSELPLPPVSL